MPIKEENGSYSSDHDVVFIDFAFALQPLGHEGGVPCCHKDKWRAMDSFPEGLDEDIIDMCWVDDMEEEDY